jgi:hypothetical protein
VSNPHCPAGDIFVVLIPRNERLFHGLPCRGWGQIAGWWAGCCPLVTPSSVGGECLVACVRDGACRSPGSPSAAPSMEELAVVWTLLLSVHKGI